MIKTNVIVFQESAKTSRPLQEISEALEKERKMVFCSLSADAVFFPRLAFALIRIDEALMR